MGEVFTVRRKTTGHHTESTKEGLKRQQAEDSEAEKKLSSPNHSRKLSFSGGVGHVRRTSFSRTFSRRKSDGVPPMSPETSERSLTDKDAKSPSVKEKVDKVKEKLKRFGGGDSHTIEADATLWKHLDRVDTHQSTHEPPAMTAKPTKGIIKSDAESKHRSTLSNMSIEVIGDIGSDMSKLSMERILSTEPASNAVTENKSVGTSLTENRKTAAKGVHFQRTFAVKTILTSRVNKEQVQEMVNEIVIMRKLVRQCVRSLSVVVM